MSKQYVFEVEFLVSDWDNADRKPVGSPVLESHELPVQNDLRKDLISVSRYVHQFDTSNQNYMALSFRWELAQGIVGSNVVLSVYDATAQVWKVATKLTNWIYEMPNGFKNDPVGKLRFECEVEDTYDEGVLIDPAYEVVSFTITRADIDGTATDTILPITNKVGILSLTKTSPRWAIELETGVFDTWDLLGRSVLPLRYKLAEEGEFRQPTGGFSLDDAQMAPLGGTGSVDVEILIPKALVTVVPTEMAECLVSFDTPAAFVQDEILTPTNNLGVTEVKVTENLTNGLIVRVTFDRAFAHRDGYIADSQLAGFNGGVWDADDYATNNSKAGMVRRKSTDWVEIFIQKEVDLSTPRNYTVLCRGLATIA